MAYFAVLFCSVLVVVAAVIYIMEKRKWKKFIDIVFPLKDTITISINGKDYEYNPTEDFEEFMKNITKPLDK
jgi:hypothetical protein